MTSVSVEFLTAVLVISISIITWCWLLVGHLKAQYSSSYRGGGKSAAQEIEDLGSRSRIVWEGEPVEYIVLQKHSSQQVSLLALELDALLRPLPGLEAMSLEETDVGSALFPPHLVGNNASVLLSVIIPAYNEQVRLPKMLKETFQYLDEACPNQDYEILVVDDGSEDCTCAQALRVFDQRLSRLDQTGLYPHLALVRLPHNSGKGAAVRLGILHARGELILFADADGATRFADIHQLLAKVPMNFEELKEAAAGGPRQPTRRSPSPIVGANELFLKLKEYSPLPPAVVFGSRAHLVDTAAVVKRSALRNLLMYGFHAVLWVLAGNLRNVSDTQCGFKLLTRVTARSIFPEMHVRGWIFDIELLMLARAMGCLILEVCVNWHEVDGSKMHLAADSVKMLLDLIKLRAAYFFGIWQIPRMLRPIQYDQNPRPLSR